MRRGFKGVWIPAEIYVARDLILTEKVLLAEIVNLEGEDGCYASNDYFADFLGVTKTRVTMILSRFKRERVIEQVAFDGRHRILKTRLENLETAFGLRWPLPPSSFGDYNKLNKRGITKKKRKPLSDDNGDGRAGRDAPNHRGRGEERKPGKKRLAWRKAGVEAREIIKYWNDQEALSTHGIKTKIVESACYELTRRTLRHYNLEDIKRAIDYFNKLVAMGEVRKQSLNYFLVWPQYQVARLKDKGQDTRSWFDRLVEGGNWTEYVKGWEKNKHIIKAMKNLYIKTVLGERRDLTIKDEASLARGAEMLATYMKGRRLDTFIKGADYKDYILVLFEALDSQWGKGNWSMGSIASKHTWREVVPKFITKVYGRGD